MKTSLSDEVLTRLKEYFHYTERRGEPFRVLISTILSQRTRDEFTEKATCALFAHYDTAEKIAQANIEEIEVLIKPAGFYRVKAQRIRDVSIKILTEYQGRVPVDKDSLLSLPGVGPKTANCILVYGFGIPAIPVDVHVHRIANRLGLVSTRTPEETENDLMNIYKKEDWIPINSLLVSLGKNICKAIPLCLQCFLVDLCPTAHLR
ncbi:MAG: endonuclease III [Theionarchaea archaeon]|nr:endonuclease III [Theionarchaea archaeon]